MNSISLNYLKSVVPVILSGGAGTRLWPLSRSDYPKQLHRIFGDRTLLQNAVQRVKGLAAPIIICGESQRFSVADQVAEVLDSKSDIILEPEGRDTAAATAIAAVHQLSKSGDAVLAVFPSDHKIDDCNALFDALAQATVHAEKGRLVSLVVKPKSPSSAYGYVQVEHELTAVGGKIKAFIEKPDHDLACSYLEQGNYYWNSGIYVFSAKAYLDELARLESGIVQCCKASYKKAVIDLDFIRIKKSDFSRAKKVSIDYAVMEKTDLAHCVPLESSWSDLGTWDSIWSEASKTEEGNAIDGDGVALSCKRTFLKGQGRLLVGVGLSDISVIDSNDALLVINRNQSHLARDAVEHLQALDRKELKRSNKEYRPWGYFESVCSGNGYKVKRIIVKPGGKLSLQSHRHRAEHWVVVSGEALVQKNDRSLVLKQNESLFVPCETKHRLENTSSTPLMIIEVQTGKYLEEDDIERYEDGYGRVGVAAES